MGVSHHNSIRRDGSLLLQRPLTWFLRSVLVLPAFVGIMLPRVQTQDSFSTAYGFCIKVRHLTKCTSRYVTPDTIFVNVQVVGFSM